MGLPLLAGLHRAIPAAPKWISTCVVVVLVALLAPLQFAWTETTENLAKQRLTRIVERQQVFYDKVGEGVSQETLLLKAQNIADLYQGYVNDHPDDVEALILFGKFLNELGRSDAALTVLTRADYLDPKIAVVKQQIAAAFLSEGLFREALPMLLEASSLEPEEPLYYYQIGQFLYVYREELVEDGFLSHREIDRQMLSAFREAANTAPEERDYLIRYAEAYNSLRSPRWKEALEIWEKLEDSAVSQREVEAIALHQARILIRVGDFDKAKEKLSSIENPALFQTRDQLAAMLREKERGRASLDED